MSPGSKKGIDGMIYWKSFSISIGLRSVNVRNHQPPTLHRLLVKLLHIPLLCCLGCQAEVDCHKGQTRQHGLIHPLTRRGSQYSEGQIDDAFSPVVRANDASEDWVVGEAILL